MKIAIFSRLTLWFGSISCLILLAALCVSPVRAELVGYWNFEGNYLDSSSNNLTGSSVGAYNFNSDGIVGKSLYVNGGKVNVGGLSDLVSTDSMTISAWVKGGTNWKNFWSLYDGSSIIQLQRNSVNNIDVYATSGNLVSILSANALSDGNFHHVVLTYDTANQTITAYTDGQQSFEKTGWTTSWSPNWITFGGNFANAERNTNGYVDEAQLYNSVLSAEQIATMYANPDKFVAGEMTFLLTFGEKWSDKRWHTDPTFAGTAYTPQIMNTAAIVTADPLSIGATTMVVDVDTLPIGNLLLPKASAKYGTTADFMLGEVVIDGPGTINFGGAKLLTVEEGVTGRISAPLAGGFTKVGAGRLDLAGTVSGGMRVSEGFFSPGNSIGTLEMATGDFVQEAGSIFLLEVEESGGVWTNDILNVLNGTATLADGIISVDLLSADMPVMGTELEFLFAEEIIANSNLDFLLTDASRPFWTVGINDLGGSYALFITPNDAAAVPEPATWCGLLLGSILIAVYMRRRNSAQVFTGH